MWGFIYGLLKNFKDKFEFIWEEDMGEKGREGERVSGRDGEREQEREQIRTP